MHFLLNEFFWIVVTMFSTVSTADCFVGHFPIIIEVSLETFSINVSESDGCFQDSARSY